jgi:cytochrome c biogenesis protein CcmG, thiol:disulfide interchange protein DsbE
VRTKRQPSEEDALPAVYEVSRPDWEKALRLAQEPCGIPGIDHQCVLLELPIKRWIQANTPDRRIEMTEGSKRLLFDIDTGLLISSRTVQAFNDEQGGYQSEVIYTLKRMSYGAPPDASVFRVPSGNMIEVKRLSPWNAAEIQKQLAGKPASALTVTDLQGNTLALADFRGKIVLLDFWTTWCPPCRADGPALEKLYSAYGGKDLVIVGISVNEDRGVVKKFLDEHPHSYPIVLTTENEMPSSYQIAAFPTYIVIGRNGTLITATEGDKGFTYLRKLLRKAGLDAE